MLRSNRHKLSRYIVKKIAEIAKVNDAQVRRDLSYLGTLGTRGVGYDVITLRKQLELELGLVHGLSAIIVGMEI